MSIEQTYPNQKQLAQKQDFKGKNLYFNHRISFDTKGPISPSSEGNSYIIVIADAFTHYVALNPVPHCNAYYAYTTLNEHWIAKFGLPEILVTDNGTKLQQVKTDIHQSQINNIQHFPLYLDCQNNHYEVDLLGTSTFKPIPYSQWIKNNTQQKRVKQHSHKKDLFPLIEKENLTDKINLSGPQTNDSKYTINQVFDLHDPLDTIPSSKLEIENIFLPPTDKITINTLKQYQNLDPVIRQLKLWHKYKTKPVKADTTILGIKTLLRYFRKFNNTTINENTDLLEYQLNESTVPCLPLNMILIAFNISHTQNIKGHSGSEKTYSNFIQNFYFPNASIWIKVLCNDCIICQLNKPYPNQKQIAQTQDFKGQSLYFNHRISFDTKGPISPSSEGNSYIMVIVDAFTHYVALNPVPHCNAHCNTL